jgi:hypothetical protein
MSTEYPLYPELSEEGAKEAQALIASFTVALRKAADEAISDLYANILPYIESDSWTNFRNDLMDGLQNYDNKRIQGEYDFRKIRQAILKNHREEIINDLNQDMVKEIEDLKEQLARERERRF